ncbi:MAG: hypothetical protein MJ071_09860 [Oscillospiraceae bacterium]|nr:hypothetical protein [Oscillospiraceae bacterium]
MLRALLASETCAQCQNCCVFEQQSTWELPTFSEAAVKRIANPMDYQISETENGRFRIELPFHVGEKAAPCPFLNPASGCTLPASEKPFACSLWPVRIMQDTDGNVKITLYRGCPGIPKEKITALKALLDSGLRDRMREEMSKDSSLLLPMHPNYIVIDEEGLGV